MSVTTSAQQILARAGETDAPEGIPRAFWELIERYRADLVNQAFASLNNLQDAEDVVQETFCEAYRNREALADVQSLGAWLRKVNRDNARNHLQARSKKRRKEMGKQRELPGRPHTTGGFSLIEVGEAVARAIDELPAELREVIVLHYWEHLSSEEVALRLRLSRRTVWRRIHDATMQLRKDLSLFMATKGPGSDEGKDHDRRS